MNANKNIIVVKYGGSLMDNRSAEKKIFKDIKKFSKKNSVIVVHGGGKKITNALEKANIETRFINGLRYTDSRTVKIVERVLEKIQDVIAKQLKNAVAVKKAVIGKRNEMLGYVGRFVSVKLPEVKKVIDRKKIVVISPAGKTPDGQILNLNADEVASGIAIFLKAKKLVFFTDVKGVLDRNGKTISVIKISDIKNLMDKKIVTGGMMPKIIGCANAVQKGVGEVDILNINLKGTRII
ncbi:MAG: acetylglutamate kinase [Elusimicrobia bacterium]|nr:acetylglutamate kinase [Elusimicrobiota bacterium]